ncbi:MAG: cupin domain-containing protein [Alphaproteobacteria bacterium]|jgi:quercetin dioxygenase-like cupin family protein|nr:cupin domain-containing protein [Alphaproteobacteria bacterium]MDP6589877.1 cupin domain-containing protein [Alphaproteobacteria bacterium]MDP6817614.1 cupin domain-containing protein [Alphaproteobacteria bacterium]|tara:strand:+ start:3712 stop:4104 length:393 start_codon:yes stop_codon:yes gene_type:complete
MPEPTIRREADLEWESWDDPELKARSDVRWKLLISGERTATAELVMGIAEIAPGGKLIGHRHSHAETYYITQGTGRISLDGVESEIAPGAAIYIPANARHETVCTSETPLAFIYTFPCDRFEEVVYRFDD